MKDIIYELQDFRYLEWAKIRHSSGTAGSFLKAYDDLPDGKRYYKLSDYDSVQGIVGHECVNEIIVQRLMDLMHMEHIQYTLVHALIKLQGQEYETYLCQSKDFKQPGESKLAFEDYYMMERQDDELPLDFCIRMGWEERIYQMFLLDYLILNRDRHGANIEVLRNPKTKTIRLAPFFDHGLSLLCRCRSDKEIRCFDVMEDRRVQSFMGNHSVEENLKWIPKEYGKGIVKLHSKDRKVVMEGLDGILSKAHQEKIWEMIWKRWEYYDSIRNS